MSKKPGKPKKKPAAGKPRGAIGCDDAVEQLYSFLDGELTTDTENAVRGHLEDCTDCSTHFECERAFLRFLEARARAQGAPEPLKRRVFEQILLNRDLESR